MLKWMRLVLEEKSNFIQGDNYKDKLQVNLSYKSTGSSDMTISD